jgi:1,5-anhydro-D-fructose reductase (1,5-anhydro-D-mannitol-forming)
MAVRIGILGLGFMGKMHFDTYRRLNGAKVAAICDVDAKKRSGDWSGIAGNIGAAGKKVNLRGIKLYARAEAMLADPGIDVADITLPTYLHARYAVLAFKAGKHVICEKPLALNSRDAAKIVAAAARARRKLFTGHCIRYWPHYAVARAIVRGRKYGKVLSACFRRFSPKPTWSWTNWLLDSKKSGLAALDLHIHDADFVQYVFGKPAYVTSAGSGLKANGLDHIVTSYGYGKNGQTLVSAEGGWGYAPGYPFNMSFTISMERATLHCPPDLQMALYPVKGGAKKVSVPAGDGYGHELKDFVQCLARGRQSQVVTPESALRSVKLIEHEVKSVRTGQRVRVKF